MCLVDLEALDRVLRMVILELVSVALRRVPESSVVHGRHVQVLRTRVAQAGRRSKLSTRSGHRDLQHRVVRDSADTWGGREVRSIPKHQTPFLVIGLAVCDQLSVLVSHHHAGGRSG
jgi:hypothetical protein